MNANANAKVVISGTLVMTHKDGTVTQQPFNGSIPLTDEQLEQLKEEDGNVRE
jgi:redox-regulated HSP33 family molecular chaperone